MMDDSTSELKLAEARGGGSVEVRGHLRVFLMRDRKMFELDFLIPWCLFQMDYLMLISLLLSCPPKNRFVKVT